MTELIAFMMGVVVTLACAERLTVWVEKTAETACVKYERANELLKLSQQNYARSLQLNLEAANTWSRIVEAQQPKEPKS